MRRTLPLSNSVMRTADLYINKGTGDAFTFHANGMRLDIEKNDPTITGLWKNCKDNRADEFHLQTGSQEYRVSTIHAVELTTYVLRHFDAPFLSANELNLPVNLVQELHSTTSGLILICGGYGQGKSTTARCLLRDSIAAGGVGVGIEEPVETNMQGEWGNGFIFQLEVKENAMADAIRKTKRYMPKCLFIGEIRDPESAVATLQVALTGILVIATAHGGSIPDALVHLHSLAASRMDSHDAANALADSISCVVHQALNGEKLTAEFLSFSNGEGIRSMVRNRQFDKLDSEIDAQRARLSNNKSATRQRNNHHEDF